MKNKDLSNFNNIEMIGLILLMVIVAIFVYFVWVGIFWLINATFGWSLNIWMGALLGIIITVMFGNK
jgi:hypothetical protein